MLSLDRVYVDKQGRVWEPDRYVRGGQLIARTNPVARAAPIRSFSAASGSVTCDT